MKSPTLSRTKPTRPLNRENDTPALALVLSSQHTSTSQKEEERTLFRPSSRQNSQSGGEKTYVETAPLGEAVAADKLSDEPEYPSGATFAIIIVSLCLSVFLMALVSLSPTHGQWVGC